MSVEEKGTGDWYATIAREIKALPTCKRCVHSVGFNSGLSCRFYNIVLVPHRPAERTAIDRSELFMQNQAAGCPHYRNEPGAMG
jgi:hypothetical protein